MELKDRNYILLDTETTGFSSTKHQVLQIGMLVINNLEVVDRLSLHIKHDNYNISPQAMKVNGIDILKHDEIATDKAVAVDMIIDFLRGNKQNEEDKGFIVIGQNVQFDLGFLENLFASCNKQKEYRELISSRHLDIMQLALFKNLEGAISLESQSLDSIIESTGITYEAKRHSAIGDCIIEFEVFKKLLSL